jgi:hypothetical protein
MKRRTIDLVVSAGGLLVAVILLVGGFVLTSNANFAKNYVRDQLSAQKITFTAAAQLSDEEKQQACLVEYAGQPLTTGKQAECYANNYIGLHLREGGGDLAGLTYSELGAVVSERRAAVEAATASNAPNLTELQASLAAANSRRETVFKGESLRGMLLTTYGFSELGAKAEQGATVAYVGAGLMFLLAGLGIWHGMRTPPTQAFAAPPTAGRRETESANA